MSIQLFFILCAIALLGINYIKVKFVQKVRNKALLRAETEGYLIPEELVLSPPNLDDLDTLVTDRQSIAHTSTRASDPRTQQTPASRTIRLPAAIVGSMALLLFLSMLFQWTAMVSLLEVALFIVGIIYLARYHGRFHNRVTAGIRPQRMGIRASAAVSAHLISLLEPFNDQADIVKLLSAMVARGTPPSRDDAESLIVSIDLNNRINIQSLVGEQGNAEKSRARSEMYAKLAIITAMRIAIWQSRVRWKRLAFEDTTSEFNNHRARNSSSDNPTWARNPLPFELAYSVALNLGGCAESRARAQAIDAGETSPERLEELQKNARAAVMSEYLRCSRLAIGGAKGYLPDRIVSLHEFSL